MVFIIDSNAPYYTDFPLSCAADAVYMAAEDDILGNVFAIVYRAKPGAPKLSVILIGAHGTSGFVDMTLDSSSRYYGACKGLAPSHLKSPVRRALAIAVLRTFATTDKPLRERFLGSCDESAAGALGSRFKLVHGKFPEQMGSRVIDAGLISPKVVRSTLLDIVYEDSDLTIDQNNELVYLLGEQLEQLFDPLSEYSPEPTEKAYEPVTAQPAVGLDSEPQIVQDICEQIYLVEARSRSEILDLLQSTLVPLRVEVLKGSFPTLSIARLNTVFPPTIDELFRINNIFYRALRAAVPFGAFEVVKACGASIPYFFRACMRHQAATNNFEDLLHELLHDVPEIQSFLKSSVDDISLVIRTHNECLSSIHRGLSELIATSTWSSSQRDEVDEFFDVAERTISVLGSCSIKSGEKGDAALRKMVLNWPSELDDSVINRRVVTVFDAVDILEPSEHVRNLHIIFVVFSDILVACRTTTSVPLTSKSGLHLPSVADMLLHAMLNGAVDSVHKQIPLLEVVAWSPILDVHFASFERNQHLFIISPTLVGSFRLLQPDAHADTLVSLLAKAKITTKTTPFHLFRIDGDESKTALYSTVQELKGYNIESKKTRIAVFLSMDVDKRVLASHDLVGAISLNPISSKKVHLKVVSKLGYNAEFEVIKNHNELKEALVNESTYLMTLSLSSQNVSMLDSIIAANKTISNKIIDWASHREQRSISIDTLQKQHNSTLPENTMHSKKSQTFVIPSDSFESMKPVTHTNKTVRRTKNLEPVRTHTSNAFSDISMEELSNIDYTSVSEFSSEETEQRDVDNWYHQLRNHKSDNDSLSSCISDSEGNVTNSSSFKNSESIQIGGFLDRGSSVLYNKNAGRAFPRIQSSIMEAQTSRQRSQTESSFETIASLAASSNVQYESFMSHETTIDDDDDFSYLASLVNSVSLSKLSGLESSNAFPSLRDTSLVRLGSYAIKGDKSISNSNKKLSDAVTIKEEDPEATPRIGVETNTLGGANMVETGDSKANSEPLDDTVLVHNVDGTGNMNYTASKPKFEPFADIESKNWMPSSIYSSFKDNDPFSPKYNFIYKVEDGHLGDRVSYEVAENWLAWSNAHNISPQRSPVRTPQPSSGRSSGYFHAPSPNKTSPTSSPRRDGDHKRNVGLQMTPQRENLPDTDLFPTPHGIHISESRLFRRMVMSSSLHTLQLASFVNQIDRKISQVDSTTVIELEIIKHHVEKAYTDRNPTIQTELSIRRQLCGCFMILMKLNFEQLAIGLLEIEWVRRTRVAEILGSSEGLWKHK